MGEAAGELGMRGEALKLRLHLGYLINRKFHANWD
jgi:hypothetical protein